VRQNLRPPEGAIGISRQEGHGVSKIALALQENLERYTLPGNDRASFGVVADALTTGEPSSGRRRTVDFLVGHSVHRIRTIHLSVSGGVTLLPAGRSKRRLAAAAIEQGHGAS